MFYYYKEKMPINMLKNNFSIEHIFPNSSNWDNKLDKDRVGNLIPIIASINSSRGNKHINEYKKTKKGEEFFKNIEELVPSYDEYNSVIRQETRERPFIKDNNKYNEICEKNEKIYIENIIKCLYCE